MVNIVVIMSMLACFAASLSCSKLSCTWTRHSLGVTLIFFFHTRGRSTGFTVGVRTTFCSCQSSSERHLWAVNISQLMTSFLKFDSTLKLNPWTKCAASCRFLLLYLCLPSALSAWKCHAIRGGLTWVYVGKPPKRKEQVPWENILIVIITD